MKNFKIIMVLVLWLSIVSCRVSETNSISEFEDEQVSQTIIQEAETTPRKEETTMKSQAEKSKELTKEETKKQITEVETTTTPITIATVTSETTTITVASEETSMDDPSVQTEPPETSSDAEADFALLKHSSLFCVSGYGFTGEFTEEHYALNRLLLHENSLDYFRRLEAEATNEGKLYALCGLYFIDNDNYFQLLEKYIDTEEYVSYASDVEYEEFPMHKLIKDDHRSLDFYSGWYPKRAVWAFDKKLKTWD
ncbi:MAG: hypothetical protein FWH05_00500 [Oscillospiraceae bacterium]|nr:hypothetical protein [Oscillospiraceae bacterium]